MSQPSFRLFPLHSKANLLLGLGCSLICSLVYRALQAGTLFPVEVRPPCFTWEWVPFSQWWLPAYLLMFVFIALSWLALPDFKTGLRFGAHLLAAAAPSWLTFLLYPTACVRPVPQADEFLYRWLVTIDGPTNCFPSLHATFGVFTIMALHRHQGLTLGSARSNGLLSLLAVMFISIVGLRQHTFSDLWVGGLIGLVAGLSYLKIEASVAANNRTAQQAVS